MSDWCWQHATRNTKTNIDCRKCSLAGHKGTLLPSHACCWPLHSTKLGWHAGTPWHEALPELSLG